MKKEGRDGFKGIEKKKKGKRKRQALIVASIEHPANTFGTRSTNLRNEIQDVSRHTVIGRLMNSRPFFFFFENVCLFLEKDQLFSVKLIYYTQFQLF